MEVEEGRGFLLLSGVISSDRPGKMDVLENQEI